MTLVGANLLLYAANHDAPEHERTRAWLDDQLSGSARVASRG
jgi:predicted nucleic acid-binding protein